MRTFICWSGQQSGSAAQQLQRWLRQNYPEADPFVSDDIEKGDPWFQSLLAKLAESGDAIVCVTKENYLEPWIAFESGAIGARVSPGRVMPLLLNLEASELEGPLKYFQATTLRKSDVLKMIRALCVGAGLSEDAVRSRFEKGWPVLRSSMRRAVLDIALSGSSLSSRRLSPTEKMIVKRAMTRRARIMDIIRIGAKPEQGWTTEPALPEYKLKAEAEKDDRQWPLEIGDLVEVQCFDPVDANGLVGEIMKPYTTAHCYTVRFTKADGGTATTEYHAMYLTRLQFLQGQ